MPELVIIPNAALGQPKGEFGVPSCPPATAGREASSAPPPDLPASGEGPLSGQLRPQLRRHRSAQRSFKLTAFPRDLDALLVAVQVGAPTGGVTRRIDGNGAVRPAHQPDQRALAGFLPAGDAGADRLMPALRHLSQARRRWV